MPAKIESPLLTGDKERDSKDMQILLIENDLTPTSIAQQLGIRPQSVSQVIHQKTNSTRVIRYLEGLRR